MAVPLSVHAAGAARVDSFDLGLDIELDAGGRLAILGPNGAGKTTTLRVIAGLTPILSGEVRLGQRVVDRPASRTFVPPERRDVGYVFQEGRLFDHLDTRENVAFGLRCRQLAEADIAARVDRWLGRIGLGGRAASRPPELSGGQARRVAVARSLAVDPGVLLLDEPFVGLDDESRAVVWSIIDDTDATVILVTHEPAEAGRLGGAQLKLGA